MRMITTAKSQYRPLGLLSSPQIQSFGDLDQNVVCQLLKAENVKEKDRVTLLEQSQYQN